MYRINVSFFLKTQGCAFLNEFLRTRLVPLLRDSEGVTQVDLLEAVAQTPVAGMAQPMDDMVLALFISPEQERGLEHYLLEVLGERLELLDKTFGECVLYHITLMREITL